MIVRQIMKKVSLKKSVKASCKPLHKTVITPNGRLREEKGNVPDRGTRFNSGYKILKQLFH